MGHFLRLRQRLRGWAGRWRTAANRLPAPKRRLLSRIGQGAWTAAWVFAVGSVTLVLVLRWVPPPTSSFIAQGWSSALWVGKGAAFRYDWTPMATISPHAALAVIAAEDQRFPDHFGFDFVEIQDALEDQDEGKPLRGASTISQQVAKNLFLWPGRSFVRKGLEVWFTVLLELLWSKQRILEVYLNIAEFGEYTFGVEAASRRFFNKPAARLTADEAARLAAVLPNPLRYRADRPSAYTLKRQRWIERQMRQLGGVAYLDQL
ncbi:MAG: monofunctional biosynthetic peptidoglycan transglycosylase [Candidatus Contendobacter sp.]|nr:MAG: monofunctional biosynthetic peptidoglycan transglycosylase [Candidatus Contendobacter sp.]